MVNSRSVADEFALRFLEQIELHKNQPSRTANQHASTKEHPFSLERRTGNSSVPVLLCHKQDLCSGGHHSMSR
jgi:hypothetical protein